MSKPTVSKNGPNHSVVRRVGDAHYGWTYGDGEQAIQFKTSFNIHLLGIGLYGGDHPLIVKNYLYQGDDYSTKEEIPSVIKEMHIVDKSNVFIHPLMFNPPILIHANTWYTLSTYISNPSTGFGMNGKDRVETGNVEFEFRNSAFSCTSGNSTNVTYGQIPEIYFKKAQGKQEEGHSETIRTMQSDIDKIRGELSEATARNVLMTREIDELKEKLIQIKIGALQFAKGTLKFTELEKLTKLLVTIQFENGSLLYFDNTKPFELFTMLEGSRVNADLKLWEGEYDCSFKGTIDNDAYFSASRGKTIRFFKVSILSDKIHIELINELSTSDLIPFENEPFYFIEESREWSVYQYHENYEEKDGEKFDISGIRSLRKYECHYHRGVLYFLRENSTARLHQLNEKVVIIEGPILDGILSFYTPPHSDYIYISNSNQNALLILNTTNLNVSQQIYEPPIDSTYHSIVGVHDGILTIAFEGKGVGRSLMTTKLPKYLD